MRYLGIFLVSVATLTLEVLQMRLFSVMLWHHLAYMVITVALLGFGAAGSIAAVRKGLVPKEGIDKRLALYSMLFAGTLFIAFLIMVRVPLDTFQLLAPPPDMPGVPSLGSSKPLQLMYVFLYYAALLPPYFFAGLIIAAVFSRFPKKATVIYFFNLIGSAIGCFAVVALITALTGDGMIILSLVLALLGAVAFALSEGEAGKKLMWGSLAAIVFFLALIPVRESVFPVSVAPTKAQGTFEVMDPSMTVESRQWDPVARIDVLNMPKSGELYHMYENLPHKIITIDGDAYTYMYHFPSMWPDYPPLGQTIYSAAYWANPTPKKVLAVGLGGGIDIATALHHRPERIVGVEINQGMIDATGKKFADFTRHIYDQPSVDIVHEEGRSYIKRSDEKFNIIQMSGVDTWSALATGAYVLSENYLYTVEAMTEYIDHLEDDGVLNIIRWLFNPPRETLRLTAVAAQALKERGIQDPSKHIALMVYPFFGALLVKKTPFTPEEIARLKDAQKYEAHGHHITPLVLASAEGQTPFHKLLQAYQQGDAAMETFYANYQFDVTPVYDDKPFFFRYYRWGDFFKSIQGVGGSIESQFPVGLWILLLSLLQAIVLAALLIIVPLFKVNKDKENQTSAQKIPTGAVLTYFAALGTAFMLIEVGLMQKLVLFLGHPSFSIATTLAALLTFSGIGSYLSGRAQSSAAVIAQRALILLLIVGFIDLFFVVPVIVDAALGFPMSIRVLLTVLVLAPLGLLMGVPFPSGIRVLGNNDGERYVPWAWGVNGALSVTASVAAILIAMGVGFNAVLIIGLACYLAAFLCMRVWNRA